MIKRIRIYTDGGSRGNPGPSASAAVLKEVHDGKEGETVEHITRYLGKTTNNQAEYTAIIIGLERAKHMGAEEVEVVMDSELAVKQLTGIYRVKNPDIAKRFMEVWNLKNQFKKVTFRHVPRERNTEADAWVNKSIDEHVL